MLDSAPKTESKVTVIMNGISSNEGESTINGD